MKRLHSLVALLLVLVYTTQALAAAGAPCPRADHAREVAGHLHEVAAAPGVHDAHRHHAPVQGGSHAGHAPGHDCCGSGGCFMNQCHALLAVPATPAGLFHLPPHAFDRPAVVAAPIRPAASAFRPPAFA